MADEMLDIPVIGIGASAGGLEAVQELLRGLPAHPGAAFVVVQHLAPDKPSMMVELLGRVCPLTTVGLEMITNIVADTLYVLPPKHHVVVSGPRLELVEPTAPRGQRLPIDLFFESLASEVGPNAMCIVLSGTGTDGTEGARRVSARGGLVIAQDPKEAGFSGMPQSAIDAGVATEVLPVADIGAQLVEHLGHWRERGTFAREPTDERSFVELVSTLTHRSGVDFSMYKSNTMRRRIERRVAVHQLPNLERYLELVRADPSELDRLYEDAFIGVTEFFRNSTAWDELAKVAVSSLVEQASADRPIRVWVPGCSTGEEAYSVAMLLASAFEKAEKLPTFHIFATDVDEMALATARVARYDASAFANVDPKLVRDYVVENGTSRSITPALRDRVVFSRHDLLSHPPFARLDLITCRNVLIYFTLEAQRRVLSLFHFALSSNGYLMLGPSETISAKKDSFRTTTNQSSQLFRRLGTAQPSRALQPMSFSTPASTPSPAATGRLGRTSVADLAQRTLVREFAPASVVVDSSDRILFEQGATDTFLGRPAGTPTSDLFSLLRNGLRGTVRKVLRACRETRDKHRTGGIRIQEDGTSRPVDVTAMPLRSSPRDALVLLSFELGPPRDPPALDVDLEDDRPGTIRQLELEIRESRAEYQALLNEYQTSNEELRASNEEVMSMNEELQSSIEELETSKEELQSLNEELNVLNDELRERISEVENAHDDIRNLMDSMRVPILVLDRSGRIRRFTPASSELFPLIESDVGRPIDDISNKFERPPFMDVVRTVLEGLATDEATVVDGDGRRWVQRATPYRTHDDRIDGIVLSFNEVTKLFDTRQALAHSQREAEERLREIAQIYEHAPVGLGVVDTQLRYVRVNERLATLNGRTADEHLGCPVRDLMPEIAGEIEALLSGVVSTHEPVVNRTIERPGSQGSPSRFYLANYFPLFDSRGDLRGIMLAVFDISERERATRRMLQIRGRYEQLLELLSGAVFEVEADGRIRFANQVARHLMGDAHHPPGSLLQLVELFEPSGEAHRLLDMVRGDGPRELSLAVELHAPDGNLRRFQVDARPLVRGGAERDGTLLVFTDVTRRLSESEQAQEKKRLEALGRLAGGVAHDFNNELQILLAQLESISSQMSEDASEELAQMELSVGRARNIVRQVLRFGRGGQPGGSSALMHEVIPNMLRFMRRSLPSDVTLNLEWQHGELRTEMPETPLSQILINLLSNAQHAVGRRGRIDVTVETTSSQTSDGPDDLVILRVRDDGAGMTEDVRRRALEPYFSTRERHEGTGLGLSVVHGLVQAAGGELRLTSELGKGTTAEVQLPLADPTSEPPRPRGEEEEHANVRVEGEERLLLVDDEPITNQQLGRMLERRGYRVDTFTDVTKALAAFESQPDGWDALITDHSMPVMTGADLCAAVHEIRENLPCIILTGNAYEVQPLIENEAIPILQKPISSRTLAIEVRKLLGSESESASANGT